MNLLQMLETANAAPNPQAIKLEQAKKKRKQFMTMAEAGWEAHHVKAVAKYRDIMKNQGWLTTAQIEGRLGYTRSSSTVFLRRLHQELKLIERRNKDGEMKYVRQRGYEYRWIGD